MDVEAAGHLGGDVDGMLHAHALGVLGFELLYNAGRGVSFGGSTRGSSSIDMLAPCRWVAA